MSISVATSPLIDPNNPPARAAPAAVSTPAMRLATADQKPDHQADACRSANCLPWIFVHEVVGCAGRLAAALHDDVLRLGQFDFRVVQAVLNALACTGDFFTGLVRSCP